jgi:hypothetical protein
MSTNVKRLKPSSLVPCALCLVPSALPQRQILMPTYLAHWAYVSTQSTTPPDWGQVAQVTLHTFLPQCVIYVLLTDILRWQPLLQAQGFNINISWCKM